MKAEPPALCPGLRRFIIIAALLEAAFLIPVVVTRLLD